MRSSTIEDSSSKKNICGKTSRKQAHKYISKVFTGIHVDQDINGNFQKATTFIISTRSSNAIMQKGCVVLVDNTVFSLYKGKPIQDLILSKQLLRVVLLT